MKTKQTTPAQPVVLPRIVRAPRGWRRLIIGEKTREGDWLEPVMTGDPWKALRKRYWRGGKRVDKTWRIVLRKTTCGSPNE